MTRRRACTVRVNMFVFLLNMLVLLPSFGRTQTEGDSNRIRQVDFYNFTYQPYCGGDKPDEPVQVKQGAFERSFLGQEDFIKFQISEIIFGDLTGDKRNEAVVVTRCSTGGTATFSEGFTVVKSIVFFKSQKKHGCACFRKLLSTFCFFEPKCSIGARVNKLQRRPIKVAFCTSGGKEYRMVILKQRHVNFRGILSCQRCLVPMLIRTEYDISYCCSKLVDDAAKTTPSFRISRNSKPRGN